MSGSFTYASFSATGTRPGGWGVGTRTGDVPDRCTAAVIPLIPTRISGADTLPTFPDRDELDRRIRRFAWLPAPWDTTGTGVLLASAAAGQDASGRPGNVFTCAFVTDPGDLPTLDAARLLYSPTIPAPFGKRKVDAAVAPALTDLSSDGPVDDGTVDRFIAGDADLPAEFGQVRPFTGDASRAGILGVLRDLVAAGGQVVLLADPAEGPLWVAALARVVPRDLPGGRTFTWSTYERATGIAAVLELGTSLCVVPAEDRDQLKTGSGVTVVDAAGPLPTVPAPAEPVAPDGTGRTASRWRTPRSSAAEPQPVDPGRNPFGTPAPTVRTVGPRRRARHALDEPDPETTSVPTPSLPDGFVAGVVPFTDADAHFISDAKLSDWYYAVSNWEATEGPVPQKPPSPLSRYLFLDPTGEPGHRVRTMVLAVLALGDNHVERYALEDLPTQALLCFRSDGERDQLVRDTVAALDKARIRMTPDPVTYDKIRDTGLRTLAALVHRRYLDMLR